MANLNIKEIVEWMIKEAKDKASDSIAVIDEGEIVKEFGVESGWLQSHGPEIYHECDRHSEVLDSLIYTGNDRDYWSIQLTINKEKMDDKYLSIITNFGCHYSYPECVVRNNKLKMTPTEEYSSYMQLEHVLKNECNDCNWVSVSGGGDPLYHWWEHQAWWTGFFSVCKELGRKIELHTSYYDFDHDDGILMFPFEQFDRVVYHLHYAEELYKIHRREKEIVRVVFVVDDSMDEYEVSKISAIVQESDDIDELTFRQYVDENYKETYHLHGLLLAGHKKAWWYVTQRDYNTYYHNGKLFTKYTDIFDSEVASHEKT